VNNVKAMVIGSGGREHALLWKLAQSSRLSKLYCAPGNGGTEEFAENVPIDADRVTELADFAQAHGVDLTIVGPEAPLVEGIADEFLSRGLKVFGPSRNAAALEGSKVFAKKLMKKYGIPTGDFRVVRTMAQARPLLGIFGYPVVIKADGLAAGKGVVIAKDYLEAETAVHMMLEEKAFGEAGSQVLIEECLTGEEVSVLAFTDGKTVLPMVSAQDHKRVWDGDAGPNTGGMGAYAPAPIYSADLAARVEKEILLPTVQAMAAEGILYQGVIYAGLMITDRGPQVLEFNARFGDPETQVILPLMQSDLVDVAEAVCQGTLDEVKIDWRDEAVVCVVMASGGYPGAYEKGQVIYGLDEAARLNDVMVFHAGTVRKAEETLTAGGRVLGVTARGSAIGEAVEKAYKAVDRITFAKGHYRRDIAHRALTRK
jgi:phosphoribosylamine---glycine ligase